MIRTVKLEVNAANPQLPLMPSEVFEDSAATFVIIGVPRAHGKQSVTGVTVGVVNPDGQSVAIPAVRDGSAWVATVHAADIGGSGKVTNGVIISASGKDENDANVEAWIIGAGDLVVMQHDGTVVPGERLNRVNWFETAPAAPKIGSIAPVGGVIKIYTSAGWVPFGSSVTLDDTVTETSANCVKSSGIWSFVKGLLPSWLTPSREEPPTQASVAAKYVKPSDGIPLSDLKPSTFPPTAHSHASDNWFTTAINSKADEVKPSFSTITINGVDYTEWILGTRSGKIMLSVDMGGISTEIAAFNPVTGVFESAPSQYRDTLRFDGEAPVVGASPTLFDHVARESALSGKANISHTHTKSEITDFPTSMPPTAHSHANDGWFTTAIESVKSWASGVFAAITHSHASDSWFTTALDGKANASDFSTSTPASYVTDFVQQSATLQAQIKSVAQSLIRTAVANFDPDEQSFADLVNILKNIGA